jgi:hypothetical protein
MNEMFKRAVEAVKPAREGGHIFDDEIARAVIDAIREPTDEVTTKGSGIWQEYDGTAAIYTIMIDEILK